MSRVFFASELETVATYWRVLRRDGVALGFTSHNRDLVFDGMHYRAAPGMVPSAIRRTGEFSRDSVEVEGMLAHDAISAADLAAGRYDHASIAIGLVDWESLDRHDLFRGEIGEVSEAAGQFQAALHSAKVSLEIDPVPRTSPTCRATFCDARCGLSPVRFTHIAPVGSHNAEDGRLTLAGDLPASNLVHGSLRWLEGPLAGTTMGIVDSDAGGIRVNDALDEAIVPGQRVILREGCDHTLATCHGRFANAVNFQGEPFMPGNDLLTRYPGSRS